jgi:molecular chaperone GrpE
MKKENKSKVSKDNDLDKLTKKCEELDANWKRAAADYQNLKRRSEQEKLEIIKFANFNLLQEFLPVLDNLQAVAEHSDDQGLKITVNHFSDLLKKVGVEELEVLDKPFNAETCEALETVAGKKDYVVEVVLKGYMFNGKLLRPARVKVGK